MIISGWKKILSSEMERIMGTRGKVNDSMRKCSASLLERILRQCGKGDQKASCKCLYLFTNQNTLKMSILLTFRNISLTDNSFKRSSWSR